MNSAEMSTEFPRPSVAPNAGLHLTAEEIAVMKECNQEAFYNRGLPMGAVFASGAYYALKSGWLKPNARYGFVPAIAIAGVVGCVTGSISYKTICLQRVLALPNSTLKQQLDAILQPQKPNTVQPAYSYPEKVESDDEIQMFSGTQMESYQSTSSFDGFTGVDVDGDQPPKFDLYPPLAKQQASSQSYEDLRRKNREDYIRSSYSRSTQEPVNPQPTRNPTQVPEDNQRFDRDRVPQYQLD